MELDGAAYQVLFDRNPLPLFVFDRESLQILLVNQAACEHYGWSREELLAMTLRDIRSPEDVVAFEHAYAEFSKSPRPRDSRGVRHWTKDGRVIEVALELSYLTVGGREVGLSVVTDVTGVEAAQQRFRRLVEHSADGISLLNESNVVEYVSPGGLRILGNDLDDVMGRSPEMRVHPEDRASWQKPEPGETCAHVARVAHRDGTWRWIESTTTNLTKDPAVRAFVTNYRDVTKRKLAEDALIESQQRLEFLLSATSAITYTAKGSGDFGATFISANVTEILGHTPADFCDDPDFWRDNIHPDDLASVDDELARLATLDTLTLQYRFRHRDGGYRWMRDVARVVRDDAGRPHEVVGYWIDVTDQVRSEASLRRSEESFRSLIERTPTAMFAHRNGHYVYCNPAAVAMFGFQSAADMVGRAALEFVHPDDREMIRSRIGRLQKDGTTPANVCRMLRADGSVFLFEAEAMRVDFDGEPSNVVMGRDVTERDQMFARIALADRMISVGTLAAGVAHEINNPLSYVAMNLETFAAELPNIGVAAGSKLQAGLLQSLIEDAREGVARMSAIVRDLRALSRADDEKRGTLDMAAVLASAIKMSNNEVRHRARIVTSYEPDLPPVDADAFRLGQVFVNLLLNAAQAIPAGHAEQNEIRIRASRVDGQRIRIDVSDTGSGMAPHVVRRIFDPFFTTKAPGTGTGLGLSISHQIVRSMNGELLVESEPGKGSTFSVILPASSSREHVDTAQQGQTRTTGRILLIDDEAAVGRSLSVLLAPETEVVAVTRADQALARIQQGERFDAILCDVMMPEISGIELYDRLLRTAPGYKDRIIFMTGGAFTPEARAFLSRLQCPRLDKPFSEAQLREAISGLVRS
ncbi:MAG TPA: PAS domain S-box protein [Kofleriaceae bacterium]|nr:PAS domain S-box protein [Kofleriaceae bacterium]